MKGNWSDIDILKLSFLSKIKIAEQNFITGNYDNFAEFYSDINSNFHKDLFSESLSEIEKNTENQLEIIEKERITLISRFNNHYPELLNEIKEPPLLLFVKGNLQAADSMAIAMVGTRRATRYGKLNAERFAQYFAQNNIIIVSGLAYGIDTYSHLSAVKAGGITYAVIASGIDKLGPSEAKSNAEKIIDSGGAIISNYHCGVSALPPYFLQRNRIIAGISKATLVVECGYKSGAMNTARNAFDESRDVFAIPGNITSEKSEGTNALIKQNKATLATSPEGMLKDLGFDEIKTTVKQEIIFNDKNEKAIYQSISLEPIHIDEIAEKTELDSSIILVKLLELEFRGIIRQLPGKNYILNK